MKRWLAVLLVLVLALSLAACGGSPAKPDDGNAPKTEDNTPADPQPADPEPEPEPEPEPVYVLKDYTVLDDENCTVTLTEIKDSAFGMLSFGIYVENKTEQTLMFSLDEVTVNGYLNDPLWAVEVAPGKKNNSTFDFSKDSLEKYGLLPIDELRFNLRVYDSEDWAAESLVDDDFTVYPTGKTADAVTYPERLKVDGEQVVVDNDKGTLIIQSVEPDGFWGYTLNVYMENKTDSDMTFSWDDVSVNGYMVDPYWASSCPGHSAAYSSISFSDSDFEENGIEEVEEIEYTLRMYNSEDYEVDDYVDDVFTYNP